MKSSETSPTSTAPLSIARDDTAVRWGEVTPPLFHCWVWATCARVTLYVPSRTKKKKLSATVLAQRRGLPFHRDHTAKQNSMMKAYGRKGTGGTLARATQRAPLQKNALQKVIFRTSPPKKNSYLFLKICPPPKTDFQL